MLRKLLFGRDRNNCSQTGRKLSRRGKSLRSAILGVERLELRTMLAAPVLTVADHHFFGVDSDGNLLDDAVKLRVDVSDADSGETFQCFIDWNYTGEADNSSDEVPVTLTILNHNSSTFGRAEVFPPSPGVDRQIRVRLTDGTNPVTTSALNIHFCIDDDTLDLTLIEPDDPDVVGDENDQRILEGETLTLGLPNDATITSWFINWGDGAIENVTGNPGLPESVQHPYQDNRDFNSSHGNFNITAMAIRNDSTKAYAVATSIGVDDVQTVVEINGEITVGQDEEYSLELSAIDPGDDVVIWSILWGDDTGDSAFGNNAEATHVYSTPGFKTVTVFAINDDGIPTEPFLMVVNVIGQTAGTTLDEVTDTLFINGSLTGPGNDTATITISGVNIVVNASMNGTNPFVALVSDVDKIVVNLGSGNDILVAAPNINVPMTINGGDGNDLITAGGGADFIDGGAGIDILNGAGGNDVLIGGNGNDMLFGQAGEDILIGGSTDQDVDAIMSVWTSGDLFNDRVAAITAILHANIPASATVFDDDATDIIMGGGGRDLVFGDNSATVDGVADLLLLTLTPTQDVLVPIT